jgi:hypothetical protein
LSRCSSFTATLLACGGNLAALESTKHTGTPEFYLKNMDFKHSGTPKWATQIYISFYIIVLHGTIGKSYSKFNIYQSFAVLL